MLFAGCIMVKKAAQATPNSLLRLARQKQGWTQKEVADRIGAPLDLNVTRWERGTSKPSAFYTQKLCLLFGKNADELGLLPDERAAAPAVDPAQSASQVELGTAYPWHVPFQRNPFFTGRDELLLLLHQQMQRKRSAALTQSQALIGLGGIGKTQIALEYVYRYRSEYQAVFWVRAANHETLVTDYMELAQLLALPGQETEAQMRVVASVKRWFAQHTDWLLIFDNADTLTLLNDFLPTGGNGHLLLTTQSQATGKIAESFSVDKLDLSESMLLLLRRAKLLSVDVALEHVSVSVYRQAQAIVEELDGLPLALDQAGAYIEETGCSLADYLLIYRQRRLVLLRRRSSFSTDYPHTVATTWALSFAQIEQASPSAAELLRLCAFLHPDALPELLITEGSRYLPDTLAHIVSDRASFNEAIQVLRSFSLIKRDPEAQLMHLHRLVQIVLKESLDEDTRRQWAERAIRMVNTALPDASFDVWSRYELCLPHVQVCAESINEYQFTFPEVIRLLHQAGCYQYARGQYAQAEQLLAQSLSICEQTFGPEHMDTANILTDQAELFFSQGKYKEAEGLYQRALAIHEQVSGHLDARTATDLNDLAILYAYQGKYEQAEPFLLQAQAIREHVLGPTHLDVTEGLNNLAWIYHKQGKYEQAEAFYKRTLTICEKSLGPEHPNTIQYLVNLSMLYASQNRYKEAEELQLHAVTTFERLLGPEHPHTSTTFLILARLYQAQGLDERAEPLYQRALTIFERTLGPDHPRVAQCLHNLAQIAATQGQYEQAEAFYQRALSISEQALGSEHPDTISVQEHYAEMLHARQKE